MSSVRQIDANRRNALLSTGPVTEEGKKKSRQNAIRHGLTAETVIDSLEDAEDYAAFEMSVTADYDPHSAVERELILRLASLLWRLRRASTIETGLFNMQARQLLKFREPATVHRKRQQAIETIFQNTVGPDNPFPLTSDDAGRDVTDSFVQLNDLPSCPLDRLSRYEAALWRQAGQIIFTLHALNRKSSWRRSFR